MAVILVTNDDGIGSHGLRALASALKSIGDVYIVAPQTEQSAVSHALTMHRPLRYTSIDERTYSVNGTPTDCVIIGVNKLLPVKPDVIVSGINHGGNLGDNITYSGTVAAAMEGTMIGIPSMAVSLVLNDPENLGNRALLKKFKTAAEYARLITEKILSHGLPRDTLLNVNIPDVEKIKGISITRQGKLTYDNAIKNINDPWGRTCYWIGGGTPVWESGDNTDLDAVHKGYISITPIHMDLTNYSAIDYIKTRWRI